jgi:ribose/xylose/arabinose/galactoside ABC-type transport system permease subunit
MYGLLNGLMHAYVQINNIIVVIAMILIITDTWVHGMLDHDILLSVGTRFIAPMIYHIFPISFYVIFEKIL